MTPSACLRQKTEQPRKNFCILSTAWRKLGPSHPGLPFLVPASRVFFQVCNHRKKG